MTGARAMNAYRLDTRSIGNLAGLAVVRSSSSACRRATHRSEGATRPRGAC